MLEFDLHRVFKSKKRSITIKCKAKIKKGLTTALYGPSGVGKSSVLRMLVGLDQADGGFIQFDGREWFNDKELVAIKDRKVGYVFQDFNLFPNMTVKRNLEFANNDKRISAEIMALMKSAELHEFLEEFPGDLSGGQRQRIAIIRSLCQNPEILLLDEPFSALDDEAIKLLIKQLKLIQASRQLTIVVICHRKDVIFEMAEEMIQMHSDGSTSQGFPKDLITRTL